MLQRLEEGHRMVEPSGCPEGMYDLMYDAFSLSLYPSIT